MPAAGLASPSRLARGELAAGGIDVAAAGEADRGRDAARLQRIAEGGDRLAGRAAVLRSRARRVVGDQVDLEYLRVVRALAGQHPSQRERLLVAVVDAGEHHVLDEHPAALARVERAARLDHVGEREALVDGHQLRAQRVVGRVQRQRQAQRHVLLGEPFDPGDPADRGDRGAAVGDPDVGQALAGGKHVVEVEHRLAHAHEHAVVIAPVRRKCKRLVDDLRRRQVAREPHAPGRAEGARQRTARLRGDADRAPPVAIAHQHRLQRAVIGGREQRLDGAVARARLVAAARGWRTEARARARRAARPGGRSSPRSRSRPWPPTPTPGERESAARRGRRGSGRAAEGPLSIRRGLGQRGRLLSLQQMVSATESSRCAWPSTSPTPASPRGARPRR